MKKKIWCSVALLAAGIAGFLLFALSPALARRYADAVASPAASALGRWFSGVPFPLFESLLLMLVIAFCLTAFFSIWRAIKKRSFAPLRAWGDGVLLALALILAGYVFLWTPVARASVIKTASAQVSAYTSEDIAELCVDLIRQANALSDTVTDAQGRFSPAYSNEAMFGAASALLADTSFIAEAPAPAKRARYPEWMKLFGIAGVYSPWTGEAVVSEKEYIVSLPFTACHEAAHAAGIGREEEANFVAYLACMEGDAYFRYSGALSALVYAMDELKALDRTAWVALRQEMLPSVQGDVYRMNGFGDAEETIWTAFVGRATDTFLRIGGQGGVGSYREMTRLLLDWRTQKNSEVV